METILCKYDIPYHKKGADHTCGAAALRMAIQALTDIDLTEAKLAVLLGSAPKIGSPLGIFEKNLEVILEKIRNQYKIELEYFIKQNGSLEVLKKVLNENYIVLINHTKLSGGAHWAVLYSIDTQNITFVDPEFGPKKAYSLKEFNWRGGVEVPTVGAFVAIRICN